MDGLEALNVFIDTSIFRKMNFYYGHPAFKALIDHINKGRCNLLLTQITVEEVRSGIMEEVTDSLHVIKKTRNPCKIMRNIPGDYFSTIFNDHNFEDIVNVLMTQFEEFQISTRPKNVSLDLADVNKVFSSYFKRSVPFGEGKKKSEFPDAFVLSALNTWADEEGKQIYIVSHDKDMGDFGTNFPNLITVKSIEEFLDTVTVYFEKLAPLAKKLLRSNAVEIANHIENEFNNLGFILEDQDGDVTDITVNRVDEFREYLISLKAPAGDTPGEAHFQLTTAVEFSADISYDNLDTASYDSEEKILIPWETVDTTVESNEIVQVDLVFSYALAAPHDFEIQELRIETPVDVYVSSDHDDGWPYK